MSGFRKFLMRGNIIDLAVAVVIGVAFNAIVQALVRDMITPLITAIVGDLLPGDSGGGLLADRRARCQADCARQPQQGRGRPAMSRMYEHHPHRR
jgi:hypothetical protein